MYIIRTKSGMLFTSTEQNETHGKEVEFETKVEADKHIEILKKYFPNENFYIQKIEVGNI